jgi:hypothetical protein
VRCSFGCSARKRLEDLHGKHPIAGGHAECLLTLIAEQPEFTLDEVVAPTSSERSALAQCAGSSRHKFSFKKSLRAGKPYGVPWMANESRR